MYLMVSLWLRGKPAQPVEDRMLDQLWGKVK